MKGLRAIMALAVVTAVGCGGSSADEGGDVRRWTDAAPRFSPDGRRIAFLSNRLNGGTFGNFYDVWVMNADGTGVRRLTNTPGTSEGAPAWSPNGDELAFDVSDGEPASGPLCTGIAVMRLNGGAIRMLVGSEPRGKGDKEYCAPAWSPDGTTIAFARGDALWTIRADGSGLRKVATRSTLFADFAWSPDGAEIAYVGDASGTRAGVAVVSVATGDVRQLTSLSFDFAPTWSPDGDHVAFQRGEDFEAKVVVVAADGSGERVIGAGRKPAWLPDGRLAYWSSEGLRLAGPRGDALARPLEGRWVASDWSRDGKVIVFERVDGSVGGYGAQPATLYVMVRSGGPPRRVTQR